MGDDATESHPADEGNTTVIYAFHKKEEEKEEEEILVTESVGGPCVTHLLAKGKKF